MRLANTATTAFPYKKVRTASSYCCAKYQLTLVRMDIPCSGCLCNCLCISHQITPQSAMSFVSTSSRFGQSAQRGSLNEE